jgi:hypothetical protein
VGKHVGGGLPVTIISVDGDGQSRLESLEQTEQMPLGFVLDDD